MTWVQDMLPGMEQWTREQCEAAREVLSRLELSPWAAAQLGISPRGRDELTCGEAWLLAHLRQP